MTLELNTLPSPEHGGDLAGIQARFPQARRPWIDLSTGINPHAWPLPPLLPQAWQALPGEAVFAALYESASAYFHAPRPAIVAAPGTQALIGWLPFLRLSQHGKSRVTVISPTYNEHAPRWRQAGHEVAQRPLPSGDEEVLAVTNPNNPDGRVLPLETLEQWASSLRGRGGWLVIDEAYVDADPSRSFTPHAPAHTNVIVLRSFGKFFGLAGVRLGFAITSPALVGALARLVGPWAVSGPACEIAARAMADSAWIAQMRHILPALAAQRDALLREYGLTLAGSHPLFCLVESPRAPELFAQLAMAGLYARRYAESPSQLRVGVVPDGIALMRLRQALIHWNRRDAAA